MRSGLFPSQKRELDKAFKKARAFDRFRPRTRRNLIGLALLGLAGTVTGFWAGSRSQPASGNNPRASPWVMSLVAAPLATLREQAVHVAYALETAPSDDRLWSAFHRLAAYALVHPEDQTLRTMIKEINGLPNTPAHARDAAALLTQSTPR